MSSRLVGWREQPITLEQWKASCLTSAHVRKGDTLSFNDRNGVISCFVKGTAVFLGAYFTKDDDAFGVSVPGNTGWHH